MSAHSIRARNPPKPCLRTNAVANGGASRRRAALSLVRHRVDETGSTSVELAIGFIAIALALALVLALSSLGLARQGLCRAAGEAARAAVSGDSDPQAVGQRALGKLSDHGAQIHISREGRWAGAQASLPPLNILGVALAGMECEASAKLGSLIP